MHRCWNSLLVYLYNKLVDVVVWNTSVSCMMTKRFIFQNLKHHQWMLCVWVYVCLCESMSACVSLLTFIHVHMFAFPGWLCLKECNTNIISHCPCVINKCEFQSNLLQSAHSKITGCWLLLIYNLFTQFINLTWVSISSQLMWSHTK